MRENLKTYLAGQKSEYFRRDRDVRFLAQALGRVLHDFAPHTDADLQWIQDEIMAQIDPKLKTKLEAMDVGGLVALLVAFGSSVEQAKEAVAQWYLISEKTATRKQKVLTLSLHAQDDYLFLSDTVDVTFESPV